MLEDFFALGVEEGNIVPFQTFARIHTRGEALTTLVNRSRSMALLGIGRTACTALRRPCPRPFARCQSQT